MSAQVVSAPTISQRRWEIDWLRVLMVLMLVPYHTARIFDHDPFYVKNDQLTTVFDYGLVRLGDAFAMKLLLLLAGAATWFALRRRSGGQYTKERFQRLLIPWIWGIFVLTPPNAYFARRIHSDYAGSFFQFYPHFFEVSPEGVFLDFTGRFTMAHLWFIFILFILSLVALPLLIFLRRESGRRLIAELAEFFSRPGLILLLAIPPAVFDWLFQSNPNPLFPIAILLVFFIYGYILVADNRFAEAIDRHRTVALILGPILYAFLGIVQAFASLPGWLEFVYYHLVFPWAIIIALLGYGKRFLGFTDGSRLSDKFLIYYGESAYSFYLLHQPILSFIGFYVVQWRAGILAKYVTIAVATFVATTALYEVLVRRFNVMRFLFGMRPKRKLSPAPRMEDGATGQA
jgi:peptidoglycan/LPS O-acetylase OafA/YrhL